MKALAALLLCVVALLHYGLSWIAQAWPDPGAAHRALFYAGQGIKGCVLWASCAWMVRRLRRFSLVGAGPAMAVLSVCVWGFIEDAQVAACRLARGIENLPRPGLMQGVCDEVAGWPVYLAGLFLAAMAACAVDHGTKK